MLRMKKKPFNGASLPFTFHRSLSLFMRELPNPSDPQSRGLTVRLSFVLDILYAHTPVKVHFPWKISRFLKVARTVFGISGYT